MLVFIKNLFISQQKGDMLLSFGEWMTNGQAELDRTEIFGTIAIIKSCLFSIWNLTWNSGYVILFDYGNRYINYINHTFVFQWRALATVLASAFAFFSLSLALHLKTFEPTDVHQKKRKIQIDIKLRLRLLTARLNAIQYTCAGRRCANALSI